MIRYKIAPDVNRFNLLLSNGEFHRLEFDHSKHIYFIDILDRKSIYGCRMKIYMPDGNILIGEQSIDWITLHHVGDVFDGRFNVGKS